LLATYITFDLSPELAITSVPESVEEQSEYVAREMDRDLVERVRKRVLDTGIELDDAGFHRLLCYVWPAMKKMKLRDEKYRIARETAFSTAEGRAYLRELSIDELPGITDSETTAVMLALCEAMAMPVNFVAPAFGFQKNMPYPDNQALQGIIKSQWQVCRAFGVSIGFHSGSGKSAENYEVMGASTEGNFEIKTSGRYTYEMGVALSKSDNAYDQSLWKDWYDFTVQLAIQGAFSDEATEQAMAREFIEEALNLEGIGTEQIFDSKEQLSSVIKSLSPNPEHMFWFEYNFLYVLAKSGEASKAALGDHSPAGYNQRARFYTISDSGKLQFAIRVAKYILFLAANTGLASKAKCEQLDILLEGYENYDSFLASIAP